MGQQKPAFRSQVVLGWWIATLLAALTPDHGRAQQAPPAALTWGGLIDAYYAYDFNQPPSGARGFATEPARHDEVNLALALVRVRYDAERVRGVVALAVGTYMESNYAAEPDHFRQLFEASGGYRLARDAWLDVGVLPSHIGLESAISAQSWTYSRSLAAEYSPYYEAGARLSWQPSARVSGALLFLNGWQTIRETNGGKAVGLQLQVRPSDRLLLNYSNYLGDEAGPDDDGRRLRFFHDFYAQLDASDRLSLAGVFDVGTQQRESDRAVWYNATLLARVALADAWVVALRGEYFDDPDEVVVATGTEEGFRTASGSAGLDYQPLPDVLLRIEGRFFSSDAAVWPSAAGLERRDAFVVSSISVTF